MADLEAMIHENWAAATSSGQVPSEGEDAPASSEAKDLLEAPIEVPDGDGETEAPEEGAGVPDEGGEEEPSESAEGDGDTAKDDPPVGSEDNPWTLDDFGDDDVIRMKVDGEEKLINLKKDIVANIGRQAALDSGLHRAKKAVESAEQTAQAAHQKIEKYQTTLFGLLRNIDELGPILEQHHDPEALDRWVVDRYQRIYDQSQKGSYEQWLATRKLQQREKLLEGQQRTAKQRAEAEKAKRALEHTRSVAVPAIKSALEKTGFSSLSPELIQDIGNALDARAKMPGPLPSYRQLTTEEITDVATKWLKAYGPQSGSESDPQKPRKPRRKPPKATEGKAPKKPNGQAGNVPKYDQFGQINAKWLLQQRG